MYSTKVVHSLGRIKTEVADKQGKDGLTFNIRVSLREGNHHLEKCIFTINSMILQF
jgi:hypothetical protein